MMHTNGKPEMSSAELDGALASGKVKTNSGPHVNTGEPCRVFVRTDLTRVLWLPDAADSEIVLQDGLEGEGEWIVASPSAEGWTVVRDYWDAVENESAEDVLLETTNRNEAVTALVGRLLS